ncbi:organoarsenical effux MFS transporter ArsJ [Lentisphaera profundi]|uniref:Organoarsenical effux MFS transporter ArsJ n=1 Tax=Lentisphaera profundi TaxID=1658616 RepID=A0ABY7VZ67_9BACT|nr:organoarsenical effux MFS transporter ArsJ [Lentisphaera profundi]WDE99226.1 organoarsenical effux MFS transporter ArsJ [Lentisphaera profundi]
MKNIKDYCIVTAAYWSFMLTDGALRMLCLLYFHDLGYSPLQLSFVFLLYEFCGVLTNLFGGLFAQRHGLKKSLIYGLSLQVIALVLLSFLNQNWSLALSLTFVMGTQALSGIAKDLTKMSSKTAVKFLIPDKSSQLFKWTAILTGSKNTIKGLGFFFGAFLLQSCGFQSSLKIMALMIFIILILVLACLKGNMGQIKSKNRLKDLFKQGQKINLLAGARVFLFGARDIWFVVALPVFMRQVLEWSYTQIGTFHASWIIGYGIVQTFAPKLLAEKRDTKTAFNLSIFLCISMLSLLFCSVLFPQHSYLLIIGLLIFGFVFALNSSLHSYLILAFANKDKAAMTVGFYYMANAIGRLFGTLLSGLLFHFGGLNACLVGSLCFLLTCSFLSKKLQNTTVQN